MISSLSKHKLFLFLFWLLYFIPLAIVHLVPKMEYLSLIIRLPIVLVAFCDDARNIIKNHLKKSSYLSLICILIIWELICVLLNTPSVIIRFLAEAYQIVEVIVILFYSFKHYGIKGMMPLYYVCYLYIFLTFATMLFFPKGMFVSSASSSIERAEWLFGSKNNVSVFLSTFSFVIILMRTKHSILSNLFSWFTVLVSCFCIVSTGSDSVAFLQGSSTGILMCCFILFTTFFSNKKLFCSNKHKLLSTNKAIVFVVVVNVFLLGGLALPFVNDFIVNVLHKSIDFSGRVYVWKAAIKYIIQSPIIGHGYTRVVFYGDTLTSTYNMFLGMMKSFGIPSVVLILTSIHSLKVTASRNIQIVMIGLLTCFINGLMSQVDLNFIVFFMTLVYLLYNNETKKYRTGC